MSFSCSADTLHFSNVPFKNRIFTRRSYLTSEIRLNIGVAALSAAINKQWGTVTHLAEQYDVSRNLFTEK